MNTAACLSASPRRKFYRLTSVFGAAIAALVAGCAVPEAGSQSRHDELPLVVVSSYPLAYLTEAVGGDQVQIEDVTSGGDAHHVELSPAQIQRASDADLVVYLAGGFQPAVEDAVNATGVSSFDALSAIEPDRLIAGDTHVWLDPTIAADLAEAIAVRLGEANPKEADYYLENAASLRSELEEIDADYQRVLANCSGQTMLTDHEAFGYLAERYGLEQIGVLGVDPDAEPSPARLGEVATLVDERQITTLFVEPAGGRAIGDGESGARERETKVSAALGLTGIDLDPLEVQADAETDFIEALRANLNALSAGLGCAAPVD